MNQINKQVNREKLHAMEVLALGVIVTHLLLLPWAVGDMYLWSQVPSFVISIIGLIVALCPRTYIEPDRFHMVMWPRLLSFPPFWMGLGLLGLIVIQYLNPGWEYKTNGQLFWMQQIPNISWLPTGVKAGIKQWNQPRMLIIYATAWLTLCTI